MTPTELHPLTTRALADLDAAPAAPLTPEQAARADAVLAQILATEPAAAGAPAARGRSRGRTVRRAATAGALAAACTTGIVAVQVLTVDESASATWTATPHSPTTPEQAAAADGCRENLTDSLRGGPDGDPLGVSEADIRSAPVVLAEQRGVWTLVVLASPDGFEASCMTHDGPLFANGMIGSMGSGPAPVAPGPKEVVVSSAGTGVIDDEPVSVLVGTVGTEVTALTVHTRVRGDVVATVALGHLAAWWPGDTAAPPTDDPVEATLTYADGSTWTGTLGMGLGGQPE